MRSAVRLLIFCTLMTAEAATPGSGNAPNWQKLVSERLPQFGHRNWIVIADSAYPAPSAPGIELVISDADQMTVLRGVMGILSHAKHVKPVAYVDQELEFLEERDAPGIDVYRQQLNAMLMGNPPQPLPHIQLIEKLDQVSHLFRVLVIKTNMTLPYTTVFLQLDCAYWPPDAEKRLRERMTKAGK